MMNPSHESPKDFANKGANPYTILKKFGLTPASSAREVWDASFDMTAKDLRDPKVIEAWESLKGTKTRLLVDFFCLELPPEPSSIPIDERAPFPPLPWSLLSRWPLLISGIEREDKVNIGEVFEMPAELESINSQEAQ